MKFIFIIILSLCQMSRPKATVWISFLAETLAIRNPLLCFLRYYTLGKEHFVLFFVIFVVCCTIYSAEFHLLDTYFLALVSLDAYYYGWRV